MDDFCTAAVVDPYLGFPTHKMNLRFRQPKPVDKQALKAVVERCVFISRDVQIKKPRYFGTIIEYHVIHVRSKEMFEDYMCSIFFTSRDV